jgi:2,3-dihydro-2,3-dihydroxybenzoate dehydrogenase
MAAWSLNLPDQVVVTGTASGLGQECAKALVASGVRVLGVDLSPATELTGAGYTHLAGSVADPDLWESVTDELGKAPGATLGYIGAAAILDVGVLETQDVAIWRKTWEVNVLGNVLALKALLPQLKAAQRAAVVVVSSIDANSAEQQLAAYASSKAALSMAVQTIALDHARTGINFNILAPGAMRAGLFERHLASAADPAQFLATREARQPIGRIVGANEVANAALFLLTDEASALFATTVTADGGLTASFDYRTGAEGSSA